MHGQQASYDSWTYDAELPTHLACLGEWQCGPQKMVLSKRGKNYLVLESGSAAGSAALRYVVPIGSTREAKFPMRWAVTKSCIAVGDPAPTSEDTVYNLELLERQSQSLFVKKPGGNRSVEFTRPGAQPSSSSRRRSDSRSRSRSQSRSTQPGLPRLPVNHIPAGIYEPSLPPGVAMKEGDWFCPNCEAHNFKRNMSCHDCTSWKPGCEPAADDWQCPKCKYSNFRKASFCRSCAAARPGNEADPSAKEKESLVSTIKRRQRESPVFKQRWYAFCDAHSGGFYDPVKHEIGFMKEFLNNIFL